MSGLTNWRRRPGVIAAGLALGVTLIAAGCDGPYQQFLDAIPATPVDSSTPVQVFLGVDGMSRRAFDQARARGAFAGWNAADLVTVFPGTSDYAWTRTLRAGSMGGYEIQYFDPEKNALQGAGLIGVAEHPLREGIAGTYPCYERFDFVGDGETWQLNSYLDPVAALPGTLDALFDVVAGRSRSQTQILAYLINVDVGSHEGGLGMAVEMLVELDRRIRLFQAAQARPIQFTMFADHGNAHLRSTLVDPAQLLRDVGVTPVETLGGEQADGAPTRAEAGVTADEGEVGAAEDQDTGNSALEAVPIVHVRVNYVALHAAKKDVSRIAARASRHPQVDLAAARLFDGSAVAPRFAVWRQGTRYAFSMGSDGTITVDEPTTWNWLGVDLGSWQAPGARVAVLDDRSAFEATRNGPYPDLFYRVATAFTHPAARFPADVLLSLPDDVASFGFTVPGAADIRAVDGFHGSLSRASTLSVVASQAFVLPAAMRSDDLATMFPVLAGVRDSR